MEMGPVGTALNRVRLLAAHERYAQLSDGELLQRCISTPDEVAFTTLVERHGAMVYGVCARIVRNAHDAEDACQATFFVLARKASSIRKQASVASWLHGVARRVSLALVRARVERQRRERQTPHTQPTCPDLAWSDVQGLLDEELARLPDRLRTPLVLCYLEGKTRDEAAAALGLSPGQLHGFLQRGRAVLRERLTKRGVTLGVGFLSASLRGDVCLALPPTYIIRVVNGAIAALPGKVLPPTLGNASIHSLAAEVLRTMLYAKLRIVSCWAIGLAVAVVVAGHWLASSVAHTSELPVQKPTDQPKSAPKENPKPAVLQLRDLREADYTFRTTHLAKNPRVTMPDATIPDKAFAAVNDEKDRTLRFTAKGDEVAILLEKNVTGKLTAKSDTERHYELQDGLFAGGRLTLTQGSDGVVVTYTIFGSGVPVIASYRGQLLPKEAPPGAASLTFRQVLRVPAEANDDFRHAVVAASSEHKAILARNYIVTGGENVQSSGLHLWYLDTDKPIRTNIGDGTRFGFVPKSTLAFNASWVADVEFWDTVTHKKVGNSLPHAMREDSGLLPAVHPDGTVMVTRSKLNQVQFWDIQTRKALTPAHEQGGMVGGLEFTVDGQWCITATYKGELCVWEAKTGKRVAGPVPHELVGSTTAYAAKPQVFVTVENNKLSDEVWRSAAVLRAAKDGREVRRVAMTGHIREIHWIDDTHLLIIGDDRQAGAPAPITRGRRLLRVVTLGPKEADVQTIVKDSRWLTNIAVARDGQYVIASPRDGTTSCWKVGTTDARWTKPGDYEIRSGDGNWVLLIGNREVIACALADGKELWRREKGEHALVQGAHIWLFGAKGVEVWQVVGKE